MHTESTAPAELQDFADRLRETAEQLEIERFRSVAAQRVAKIGTWETDLASMSVTWSEEAHRIFETDPSVFSPTHPGFVELVHPEDRAGVDEAFRRSLDQRVPCSIEHRVLLPDGRTKVIEERWQIFFDGRDMPARAVGTCQDITERRQTEKALWQSAAEFRTLAEAMPQLVWMTRPDGWTIYFNQQWMDYTGLSLEESLGHGWNSPFHPEDRQRAWDAWQIATRTSGVYSLEARLRRTDGVHRWWLIRGVPVQDDTGRIVKWVGTCTDIHDLKEAELRIARVNEELRASEENFRHLAGHVSDVFWISSPDMGTFHYVSPAFEWIWGRTVESLYADPGQWFAAVLPEQRERVQSAFAKLGQDRSIVCMDYPISYSDGSVRWISSRGFQGLDAAGNVIRITGIACDITERKQSEESVRRALRRLHEAQSIGQIGDWELNLLTGAITWSPQVFKIVGRDPQLGPPRDLAENADFYDPPSQAIILETIDRAVATGEAQPFELLVHRSDGTAVPVQGIADVKKNEAGRVVGMYGTIQDISARKRAEQVIRDRARQQELIARLGRSALADIDLDQMFAEAASAVAEGLNVQFSKILQLAQCGDLFIVSAGEGWEPGWVGRRIPLGAPGTRLAEVVSSRQPLIVDDFPGDPRISISEILRAHGISSGVDLPIVGSEGTYGVLGGYSREVRKFNAENLDFLGSIANILGTVIDRKRKAAQLEHLAQYDPLTDLPNRTLLNDRLAAALSNARRLGTRLAVLFLDLDQFKDVNDSFGHGLGDLLLQEIARRLMSSVRESDTVSRQGGDEFLVVIPHVKCDEDAAAAARRLVESMAEPVKIGNLELLVTGSIGIACFPEHGEDAETLLRNADAAMYAAKEMGRNCHQFYSEEMSARARGRLMLEADLSRAIERDELFLQFQPQVKLGSGAVTGVEALVRWRHAALGIVPPGQFIPVAEDNGLILSIGNWVLETACLQQARWLREGLARGPMAVNVSAPQFRQPVFVDFVIHCLERSGIHPSQLELELTESVVMHRVDMVREKLVCLSKLGVRLAIDDFGTGQSSLSYLKQFPIDRLKIDRSFVSGLTDEKESRAIIQAVISMGHSLGLNVIAEGIETRDQAAYLERMGCDDAQGFFYCRPVLPEDYPAFLRSQSRTFDVTPEGAAPEGAASEGSVPEAAASPISYPPP